MRSRLLLGLLMLASFAFAAPAQAAPGAMNVLVTGNQDSTAADLAAAIALEPGVASASSFDTSAGTPTAASLTGYDLIVSIGDSSYQDSTLWGNLLADYIDAGGPVLQTAYDNWGTGSDPIPLGRFASGNYPPLLAGDNENLSVTIGSLVPAGHPIVDGITVGSIPTTDNTTTPINVGATLLARWSDGRNAIAFKGRVAAISASPGDSNSIPGIARLARNTGNYLGRRNVTVTKSGTGKGTVTGTRDGVSCGELCGGIAPLGTQYSFTATPAKNSRFTGWTGSCTGTGACSAAVKGSDITANAVFDLARFGKKTNVTLSAKVSGGKVKVKIRNANDFSITGSLSGKVGKAKSKAKKFSVKAKGSKTVTIKLPTRSGKLKLTAKVKDPAKKTRTVRKSLKL